MPIRLLSYGRTSHTTCFSVPSRLSITLVLLSFRSLIISLISKVFKKFSLDLTSTPAGFDSCYGVQCTDDEPSDFKVSCWSNLLFLDASASHCVHSLHPVNFKGFYGWNVVEIGWIKIERKKGLEVYTHKSVSPLKGVWGTMFGGGLLGFPLTNYSLVK